MTLHNRSLAAAAKVVAIFALAFAVTGKPAAAQSHLSGTYRCVSVEVGGKAHPCTAPALKMNSDGSYEMMNEHGTYEIQQGRWLVLSATKNRDRARLNGSKDIVFEFVSNGKKSKVTYRRKYQRPPAWVSG